MKRKHDAEETKSKRKKLLHIDAPLLSFFRTLPTPEKLFFAFALALYYVLDSKKRVSINDIVDQVRDTLNIEIRKGDSPLRVMCTDLRRIKADMSQVKIDMADLLDRGRASIFYQQHLSFFSKTYLDQDQWNQKQLAMLHVCRSHILGTPLTRKWRNKEKTPITPAWNLHLCLGNQRNVAHLSGYELQALVHKCVFKGYFLVHLGEWSHGKIKEWEEIFMEATSLPADLVSLVLSFLL